MEDLEWLNERSSFKLIHLAEVYKLVPVERFEEYQVELRSQANDKQKSGRVDLQRRRGWAILRRSPPVNVGARYASRSPRLESRQIQPLTVRLNECNRATLAYTSPA